MNKKEQAPPIHTHTHTLRSIVMKKNTKKNTPAVLGP